MAPFTVPEVVKGAISPLAKFVIGQVR